MDALSGQYRMAFQPDPSLKVIEVVAEGDELVFRVEGQIKIDATGEFHKYFEARLNEHGLNSAAIDCANVTFIDSQGLALLLLLNKVCQARGGGLTLRRPDENLRRLIAVTHLTRFVRVL